MLTPLLDSWTVLPDTKRDAGSVEGVHDGALYAAPKVLVEL
jgi:hypothetical protein